MQVPIHDFGKTHIKRLQASPSWTSENGDCFFPYEEQCKVGHKMKFYHLAITIIIPKPNHLDYLFIFFLLAILIITTIMEINQISWTTVVVWVLLIISTLVLGAKEVSPRLLLE